MTTCRWLLIGAVLLTASVVWRSVAQPLPPLPRMDAMNTRVGIVNMHTVRKGYKKFDFYENELKRLVKPHEDKINDLAKELKARRAVAKDANLPIEQWVQTMRDIASLKEQVEAESNKANQILDTVGAEQTVQLYKEIEEAVKAVAIPQGIGLVFYYSERDDPAELYTARSIQRRFPLRGQTETSCPAYWSATAELSASVVEYLRPNGVADTDELNVPN